MIRGRCRCGHWAFFHRQDPVYFADPCTVAYCGCSYWQPGEEAPLEYHREYV